MSPYQVFHPFQAQQKQPLLPYLGLGKPELVVDNQLLPSLPSPWGVFLRPWAPNQSAVLQLKLKVIFLLSQISVQVDSPLELAIYSMRLFRLPALPLTLSWLVWLHSIGIAQYKGMQKWSHKFTSPCCIASMNVQFLISENPCFECTKSHCNCITCLLQVCLFSCLCAWKRVNYNVVDKCTSLIRCSPDDAVTTIPSIWFPDFGKEEFLLQALVVIQLKTGRTAMGHELHLS